MRDLCLQISDDGSIEGTSLKKWQSHIFDALSGAGHIWTSVSNYKRWIIEAGFEDMIEVSYR